MQLGCLYVRRFSFERILEICEDSLLHSAKMSALFLCELCITKPELCGTLSPPPLPFPPYPLLFLTNCTLRGTYDRARLCACSSAVCASLHGGKLARNAVNARTVSECISPGQTRSDGRIDGGFERDSVRVLGSKLILF